MRYKNCMRVAEYEIRVKEVHFYFTHMCNFSLHLYPWCILHIGLERVQSLQQLQNFFAEDEDERKKRRGLEFFRKSKKLQRKNERERKRGGEGRKRKGEERETTRERKR